MFMDHTNLIGAAKLRLQLAARFEATRIGRFSGSRFGLRLPSWRLETRSGISALKAVVSRYSATG
jgi:hypothetical protein